MMLLKWDENRRLTATLSALFWGAFCFMLAKNGILPVLKYLPELGVWSFASVEGEIEQKYFGYLALSVIGFLVGGLIGSNRWVAGAVKRNQRAVFIAPAVVIFFLSVLFLVSLFEFI